MIPSLISESSSSCVHSAKTLISKFDWNAIFSVFRNGQKPRKPGALIDPVPAPERFPKKRPPRALPERQLLHFSAGSVFPGSAELNQMKNQSLPLPVRRGHSPAADRARVDTLTNDVWSFLILPFYQGHDTVQYYHFPTHKTMKILLRKMNFFNPPCNAFVFFDRLCPCFFLLYQRFILSHLFYANADAEGFSAYNKRKGPFRHPDVTMCSQTRTKT